MEYLADTQIIIWALVSPENLKPAVQTLLQQNTIWVSQISLSDQLLIVLPVAENLAIVSADEQFRQYVPQIQLVEA